MLHFRTWIQRGAALLPLVLLAACSPRPALPVPDEARAQHVIIVSIDGLRGDAIEASGASELRALMDAGAYTTRARTIVPSLTLPSHTSMLTGVGPDVHGVSWNDDGVRNETHGSVSVPTVFDVAAARGLRTAAFVGKTKLRYLFRDTVPAVIVAPPSTREPWDAQTVTNEVLHHLRFHRPNLMFVHLGDADLAGHAFGWGSLRYRAGVRRASVAVERIRQMADRTFGDRYVLIVTADHGGTGRAHGTDRDTDVLIPWIAYGAPVRRGELSAPIRTMDTAATALWLLGVVPPREWEGRAVAAAFTAGSVASAY